MFSGQPHLNTIGNIPYSFGLDSCVQPGVHVHIWSFRFLHAKFPDLFAHGACFLKPTMDAVVNVDGVFWGHFLDGRMAFLATLRCGSQSAGPWLEMKAVIIFLFKYCILIFLTCVFSFS